MHPINTDIQQAYKKEEIEQRVQIRIKFGHKKSQIRDPPYSQKLCNCDYLLFIFI